MELGTFLPRHSLGACGVEFGMFGNLGTPGRRMDQHGGSGTVQIVDWD